MEKSFIGLSIPSDFKCNNIYFLIFLLKTFREEKSLNQILFELQFINDLMKIIYELQEQA